MTIKLNEEYYAKLASALNNIIPVEWDKVLFYAEVEEDAVTQFFYFKEAEKDEYIQGGDIYEKYDVSRKEYLIFVSEVSDLILKLVDEYTEKAGSKWSTLTYSLESNGNFKADFGYEDLEELSQMERREIWEKKHLS